VTRGNISRLQVCRPVTCKVEFTSDYQWLIVNFCLQVYKFVCLQMVYKRFTNCCLQIYKYSSSIMEPTTVFLLSNAASYERPFHAHTPTFYDPFVCVADRKATGERTGCRRWRTCRWCRVGLCRSMRHTNLCRRLSPTSTNFLPTSCRQSFPTFPTLKVVYAINSCETYCFSFWFHSILYKLAILLMCWGTLVHLKKSIQTNLQGVYKPISVCRLVSGFATSLYTLFSLQQSPSPVQNTRVPFYH
jgi:hypothetical protein